MKYNIQSGDKVNRYYAVFAGATPESARLTKWSLDKNKTVARFRKSTLYKTGKEVIRGHTMVKRDGKLLELSSIEIPAATQPSSEPTKEHLALEASVETDRPTNL